MKKDGILILALAAIGAGFYFSTQRKGPAASKVGTTGTAGAQATSFWDALIGQAASRAGQRANGVINGGGWSGGGKFDKNGGNLDVTPIVKGAIGAVSGLIGNAGKWFSEKLFGGSQRNAGTSPGTSNGFGTQTGPNSWRTPYVSTWNDYREAQADGLNQFTEDDYNSTFDQGEQSQFNSYNEAVAGQNFDDAYDGVTDDDFFQNLN